MYCFLMGGGAIKHKNVLIDNTLDGPFKLCPSVSTVESKYANLGTMLILAILYQFTKQLGPGERTLN